MNADVPLHGLRAAGPLDGADEGTSKAAATDALLLMAGQAVQVEGQSGSFDGADVSLAGLGERVHGAPWWDAGRGGVRLAGCSLAGASLRGADLSGADLGGADLSGASCSGIVLHQARLEEAKLREADLIGSTLTDVDAGEADFSESLLEDAVLAGARLRFADFSGAVMDGADLSGADLWGAKLQRIEAQRAGFRRARLDETHCSGADLTTADLTGATLRRADLSGARLRGTLLRDAVLDGANLSGADLGGAVMPHVELTSCNLHQARFAGAWLDRTRLRAHQIGGMIGEEAAEEFEAAREGYIVLEQNFRTLGLGEDMRWAFLRRRRMGKRLYAQLARAALAQRDLRAAFRPGLLWLADLGAEVICDYGESLWRVLRTLTVVLLAFALAYWLTGALVPRDPAAAGVRLGVVDYLLFSLDSMTTVGTGELGSKAGGLLGQFMSSIQTVLGIVLLGLFGFVLGARMQS